jgi:4-amino-4-deoxy-L-arabinose transferase-like glycosyltransferase
MLMPFLACAPSDYLLMKSIPLVSAIGAVILLNALLKGTVTDRQRKVIILLFGMNPWTVEYSGLILTDMPYLFFTLACFVFFKKYEEEKKRHLLVLSNLFAGVCLFTRPFGITLCGALFAFEAIKRRWRDALLVIAVLLILLMPFLVHIKEISSVYVGEFLMKRDYYMSERKGTPAPNLIRRAGYNLLVYTGNYLPDIIARPAVSAIDPRLPDKRINPLFLLKFVFGVFIGGLVALGFFRTSRERFYPYHLYALFHLMMNLVHSVYVARYLVSLLPFIVLFLVAGVAAAAEKFLPARPKAVAVFAAILIALSVAGAGQQVVHARTGHLPPEAKSFVECNDWLKANLPKDAVVLSRKPSYTKVYTGRETVGYKFIDDPDEQLAYISDRLVDYVIVGDLGFYLDEERYLLHAVKKYPGRFRLLYTTRNDPKNYIYGVIRPPETLK